MPKPVRLSQEELTEMCLNQLEPAARAHTRQMLEALFNIHSDLCIKMTSGQEEPTLWEICWYYGIGELLQQIAREGQN